MRYLNRIFNNVKQNLHHKPLIRGMVIYSVTWPVSSLIQQYVESRDYNLARAFKFSLYGTLYVAPTLYGWMKISCAIWPKNTFKNALIKASVEQITYSPFAMCSFFFIMTVLEGGSVQNGCDEISNKLLPTWKVAILVWPFLQTVNYSFIPERNRVPFIGLCSLAWTVFLTFVKYQENDADYNVKNILP